MPKVSVIIPTFNRAILVQRALKSVFDQTLADFEIIVVDDGSTDDTAEVVKNLASDPRLRYFRLEVNRGVANARNFGLTIAHGK